MAYFNDQAAMTPGLYGAKPVNPNIWTTGGLGQGFYNTPEGQPAGYNSFVQGFAGNQSSHFANWLQSRAGKTQADYIAGQANNPDLRFTDYLQGQQGNLQNEYAGMNPTDRGGQTGQRGLRWL